MNSLCKTPENKQSLAEKKADKRIRIMRAAIDLFREKGYDGTRIIDIARKAGIGKGTVYAYFTGKDTLVYEIVRDIVLTDYHDFFGESDNISGAEERLRAHLVGSEKMIERYGLYARIFFEQIVRSLPDESGPVIEIVKRMTRDQYRRVRIIIEIASEEKRQAGGRPLSEEEIEDGTKLAIMMISSHLISIIDAGEAKNGKGFGEIPVMDKEKVADFILKGIGLKDITIKEAEHE